jgi:hypothetical protein
MMKLINILKVSFVIFLLNIFSIRSNEFLLSFEECKNIATKIVVLHTKSMEYKQLERYFSPDSNYEESRYFVSNEVREPIDTLFPEPPKSYQFQEKKNFFRNYDIDTVKSKDYLTINEIRDFNLWSDKLIIFEIRYDSIDFANNSRIRFGYFSGSLSYIIAISREQANFYMLRIIDEYLHECNQSKEDRKKEFKKLYQQCIRLISNEVEAESLSFLYLTYIENTAVEKVINENHKDEFLENIIKINEPVYIQYDSQMSLKYRPKELSGLYNMHTTEPYKYSDNQTKKVIIYDYDFYFFTDGTIEVDKSIDYLIPAK